MELSLTSVVLATSLDRSNIDFVVYDDEDIIDKYKYKLEKEIDSGIKFVCISTTFFWDMNHLQKVINFFHQRDKDIKIILGGQGLTVWGDSAYEKLNNIFCFCYGDIDYFGSMMNVIGNLLYFSVVVFSTVGFGDIAPINAFGKSVVIFEGLLGTLILSILIIALYKQLMDR